MSNGDIVGTLQHKVSHFQLHFQSKIITIFVMLGLFRHSETVTNIKTWIKSHRYWRML